MAELKKLTFPANGRVVQVSEETAKGYTALGWVEQKTQTKEATDAKPVNRRRKSAPKSTDGA